MNISVLRVLRLVSKVVLLVVALGIVGYGGFLMYKSIINKPHEVRVTNITSSAFSVSWITDSPSAGIVYYGDADSFLPGPLSWFGKKSAVDDRDYAKAQDVCVSEFNEDASKNKDTDFTVDANGFDCENITVKDHGKYYTHHVTLKNLDSEKDYYFRIGDGYFSIKGEVENAKTFSILKDIKEPSPIFGRVMSEDGNYASDSIVYVKFNNGREKKVSQYYSSVTNDSGGWYLDGNYVRTDSGDLVGMERAQDSFEASAQYKNYELGEVYTWIYGYFNAPYPDMTVREIVSENVLGVTNDSEGVVLGADDCSFSNMAACDEATLVANQAEWGYGNVARALAGTGVVDQTVLHTMGLDGDGSPTAIAGNLCAIAGSCTVLAGDLDQEDPKAYIENGVVKVGTKTPIITDADPGKCVSSSHSYSIGDCIRKSGGKYDICTKTKAGEVKFVEDTGGLCTLGGGVVSPTPSLTTCSYVDSVGLTSTVPINQCIKQSGKYYICLDKSGKTELTEDSGGICSLGMGASAELCNITGSYDSKGKLVSCSIKCGTNEVIISDSKCKRFDIVDKKSVVKLKVYELDLEDLDKKKEVKLLLDLVPETRDQVVEHLEDMMSEVSKWEGGLCNDEDLIATGRAAVALCRGLGGRGDLVTRDTDCTGDGYRYVIRCSDYATSLLNKFISKTYAQDNASDGYTLYLPEYGMYSFQLGNYTLTKDTTDGNTSYMFYIEANGKAGFQMPADLDNPTVDEDIVIKSASSVITYEKVASAQTYKLTKGINIISFNLVPLSQSATSSTAQDIITQAKQNGVEIEYITTFEGGRWSSGYSCSSDTCSGDNFTIIPGRGYLVYVTEGGEISIPGYNLKTSIPINFSSGWNLVGVNGYTKAYTASSFIESVNTVKGLTADNVTWWPTSKGMYEGLQTDDGQEYGLDFPISPTNGYFVRISSYSPDDAKCKSLIWNEGGTLNGSCGINN